MHLYLAQFITQSSIGIICFKRFDAWTLEIHLGKRVIVWTFNLPCIGGWKIMEIKRLAKFKNSLYAGVGGKLYRYKKGVWAKVR